MKHNESQQKQKSHFLERQEAVNEAKQRAKSTSKSCYVYHDALSRYFLVLNYDLFLSNFNYTFTVAEKVNPNETIEVIESKIK